MNDEDQTNVGLKDHPAAAEKVYQDLVAMLKDDMKEARSLLLDEESPLASNYRGLLLGRLWGIGATYEELYWSRLRVDVLHTQVFNVCTGQFTMHESTLSVLSLEAITNRLQQITDWTLLAFPVNDRQV